MQYLYAFLVVVSLSTAVFGEGDSVVYSFALVGDIMPGSDYPEPNLPPDGGRFLLEAPSEYLRKADVAIGNMEGTITSEQECAKVMKDGYVYAFRTPPYMAGLFERAGFDVLNTANNHSRDFGQPGSIETEMVLNGLGIKTTGRRGTAAVVDVRDIKVAVIGFSPYEADNSLLEIDNAVALVDSMESIADVIVVTFHGGAEGENSIHLGDSVETYLGENRGDLRLFAHSVIDAGADIVFGHGPHVPRGMEVYNDRIIAYSLGNFCTWKGLKTSSKKGLAPLLWVEIAKSGELTGLKVISYEQETNHYPVLDPLNRAAELMLELSRSDFESVHPLIEGIAVSEKVGK